MVVFGRQLPRRAYRLAMDFLAIAVAELGNISERRIYRLISGTARLPTFLVAKPGLNSGFMIPQYTAASIVSQTKGLCWPASVDSIPSSQGQEDHVSMGSNAATKLTCGLRHCEQVLAIELFNAAQALDFRHQIAGPSSEPSRAGSVTTASSCRSSAMMSICTRSIQKSFKIRCHNHPHRRTGRNVPKAFCASGAEMDEVGSLRDACLSIDGERISGFGHMSECPVPGPQDEVIDAEGGMVIPAFCNSHTHICYAGTVSRSSSTRSTA